jgi:uncharacterized protein YraI
LNVRQGPSVAYPVLTRLTDSDQIIIQQRTPEGDWLDKETSDQKRGMVAADFI